VTVDAIFGDVQLSVDKPLYIRVFEVPLQDFVPFFSPQEILCYAAPKGVRMFSALAILFPVFIDGGDLEWICPVVHCLGQLVLNE
jgi:hypothetical protein